MNSSLDLITDPENIAMGESFVANNNNVKSLFENPAAIKFDYTIIPINRLEFVNTQGTIVTEKNENPYIFFWRNA